MVDVAVADGKRNTCPVFKLLSIIGDAVTGGVTPVAAHVEPFVDL